VNNENKLCGIPIQKKPTKSNKRKRVQKQQQQKQRIKTQTLLEKVSGITFKTILAFFRHNGCYFVEILFVVANFVH